MTAKSRVTRACVLWLALGCLIAAPARAGSGQFAFALSSSQTENCVEQQSGGLENCSSPTAVINPTPCIWTVDQYSLDKAYSTLDAGATATDHLCLITDGITNWSGEPHWITFYVSSPRQNLSVTLTDQFGDTWAPAPTVTKDGATWTLCLPGPSFSSYPTIPNSNGGYGVEVDYTLNVRNTTSQAARSLYGQFEIQGFGFAGC